MKYVLFELSMPNNNAWNGKWSQADKLHCRVRSYPFRKNQKQVCERLKNVLSTTGCYYNFGDGWGANVHVDVFEGAKAKNAAIKGSKGFCGYDWMVDSIISHGKILNSDQIAKLKETSRMKD